MSKKYPAPAGLSKRANKRWNDIVTAWDLRPDELRILEDACREMDLVDELEKARRAMPLMIEGSTGQLVVNPLVQEVRQHRSILSGLLRALKLPESDDERAELAAESRSASARHAAKSRWTVHHGAA